VKTDKNGKPFYLQGSIPTESDAVWAEVEAENGCHLKGDFNIKKVNLSNSRYLGIFI
jgi:hypothetical protein